MTEVQTPREEELNRKIVGLERDIEKLQRIAVIGPDPVWIALPFAASTSNFGAPYPTCAYRKDKTGRVYLRGMLKYTGVPVNGQLLATLPAGYRPVATETFCGNGSYAGGSVAFAVEVDAAGTLRVYTVSGVAWTGGNLALAGITYDAA